MEVLKWWDERVKKLGIIDIKLAQAAAIFLALIVVKLIPEIMDVNIWLFAALVVICAIRPLYMFFIKN